MEITGICLFREKKLSTVTCQWQNRFDLIWSLQMCSSGSKANKHTQKMWLHGSVATLIRDAFIWRRRRKKREANTLAYVCRSPNSFFFMWQGELFMPPEQKEYISMYWVSSKFSFLWAALFQKHIYINKSWCVDSETAVSATAQSSGWAAFLSCQCLH